MRLNRLFRTSTFRFALLYALAFALSGALVLGLVYWSTAAYLEREVDAVVQEEYHELTQIYETHGLDALVREIGAHGPFPAKSPFLFALQDSRGQILASNISPEVALPSNLPPQADISFGSDGMSGDEQEVRIISGTIGGDLRLLIGRDLDARARLAALIEDWLAIGLLATAILGVAGGLFMSRMVLRRTETINSTAERILNGKMNERVPRWGNNDEFDQLADKINSMLAQIERVMAAMREVTDNVAHELRSPLARMRNRLEVTLMPPPKATDEYREVIQRAIEDLETTIGTFNALLGIAQIEAGIVDHPMSDLDLEKLVVDVTELYRPLADEKEIALEVEIPEGLSAYGNEPLLAQALANLLDNAVKYTPPQGRIEITTEVLRDRVALTVADSGQGIPEASRGEVLERFVRLEPSRSQPGTGLGLSLVAAVVDLHQAELRFSDNAPGLRACLLLRQRISAKRATGRKSGNADSGSSPDSAGIQGAAFGTVRQRIVDN